MPGKSLLDSIEIKSPCAQSWSEMRGTDQIRFCDHCSKHVHNLSRFTRKDARRLVRESNGEICVQYVRRPDGRIETLKKQLHQITRRTGLAAGILGTSITVSTAAYAQAPTETALTGGAQTIEIQKTGEPDGAISGTITDQNGAIIPFAVVTVAGAQSGFYQMANTDADGFYAFRNLPADVYKIKFEAGGFEPQELAQVAVGAGASVESQNARLSVQIVQEQVAVGANELPATDVQVLGGSMISISTERRNNLVLAAEDDNLSEVKMRISMGERVNAKDKGYNGNSALHVAVENGNLEIAEVLLNAGAKINSKNADKRTPLMMLDEDASAELVNLLLRHGAKINSADRAGNTALIFAAAYSTAEVVQILIGAGADVNAVNKQGATALINAAENGDAEIVQALLTAGANADARNRDGKTALSLVKNEDAKQFLIAYGAR